MAQIFSPETLKWRTIGVLFLIVSLIFIVDFSITPPQTLAYIPDPNPQDNIGGEGQAVELSIAYDDPDSWIQTIAHPGASSLAVHFLELNLADGDSISITNGIQTLTYPGSPSPKNEQPGIWSTNLSGDSITITLNNQSGTNSGLAASIDYYLFGYSDAIMLEEYLPEVQIGTDDKQDVVCYKYSNPDEYSKSKAVLMLTRTYWCGTCDPADWYQSYCTAWRVNPIDGTTAYILTNNHCVEDTTMLEETTLNFGYLNSGCGTGTTSSYDVDYTRTSLEDTDADYDWTLISVTDDDDLASYGYLELDPRTPVFEETIYIPQHPEGLPKMFGIDDSENGDTGLCRIDVVLYPAPWYDPDRQTGYFCDTDSGSSGAPVIAGDNHRVIALNNQGVFGAINLGIRLDLIWSDLDDYLRPAEVLDKSGPEGTQTNTGPFTFTWDNDPTADYFKFYVKNGDYTLDQSDIDKGTYCSGDTCTYTPAETYDNDDYEWNAYGVNSSGFGPEGTPEYFTVAAAPGQVTANTPDSMTDSIRPTYEWDSLQNTLNYQLLVSHPVTGTVVNTWLSSAEANCTNVCEFKPPEHLRTGNHTWWVRGGNAVANGAWSTETWFRVWNLTPPDGTLVVTSHTHREVITETQPDLTWNEVARSSWYKVYISDSVGKLYNQYHRAADICYSTTCTLDYVTYSPLFYEPRSITDFPTNTWIHFYAMPVNVAGNGPWTGPVDFWISP